MNTGVSEYMSYENGSEWIYELWIREGVNILAMNTWVSEYLNNGELSVEGSEFCRERVIISWWDPAAAELVRFGS